MLEIARFLAAFAALVLMMAAVPSLAQESEATSVAPQSSTLPGANEAPSLETLLQQFNARAPEPPGGVLLDAWVENSDAGREVVVVVAPEGKIKLVADPGITVTPTVRPGVDWQVPLPLRLVDTERDYFDPPAMVRLPFTSADDQPLHLLVEYAYCLVDFQCFFGEEELTVATAAP